jgi:hypothetical protein
MKTFCCLLIPVVLTAMPIYAGQAQRKPLDEHWKNAQPGRLQDSGQWSKRSADHQKLWKNDWHAAPGCKTSIGRMPSLESYKMIAGGQNNRPPTPQLPKIETSYDSRKDRTTVRLAPVEISGEKGRYHSVHMTPSFSFPGHQLLTPATVDLELLTVVKGRLSTDLYVVFIIDGETVFLSSNRWAIKRPVPGRVWVGERLVFRMPYQTFVKITNAKEFEIKFDRVKFSVDEKQREALREFLSYMKPGD